MLLLDEPIAGLGIAETRAMAALLASVKGRYTILLIEHDMDVVFSLADRVSVLVGGRLIASGITDDKWRSRHHARISIRAPVRKPAVDIQYRIFGGRAF